MARKQVGRVPDQADDAIDKEWAQEALSTKYSKPPLGIPTLDIAPSAVSVDRLQTVGPPNARTVLHGDGRWGVILGNFMVAEPTEDYLLELPTDPTPVDGEMVMIEVHPVGTEIINVTVPDEVRLTSGLIRVYEIPPNTSCLLGLRWSDRISAWHLLTVANEI